jgi:CheY-like chemotaxis protein
MPYLLIVDDDADARGALSGYLKKRGYEIECVPNGRQALSAILNRLPDLMVLDLYMPEMDGCGLLAIVRSYLRLQSLPVVVFTALENNPMIQRARQLKLNSILIKTKTTLDELANTVAQELGQMPT